MDLEPIRERFRHFADVQGVPSSPLYVRFAEGIAEDPNLLEIASAAPPGQPAHLHFFAAVHYLLLQGESCRDHPLRTHYPDLTPTPGTADPFRDFQAFCYEHDARIRDVLRERIVQTNEVRRSSAIPPGVATVYAEAGNDLPLSWIEIGASAGLNLLWDRYFYRYGDALEWGDPAATVHISCGLRGEALPPIPPHLVSVAFRLGIDRNPLDPTDPDTALWLRALIWPEQADRMALLAAATAEARQSPPPLVAGDALALLPDAIAQAPPDSLLCVFHSYTIYQFTPEMRRQLDNLLRDASYTRPIYRLGVEGVWEAPTFPLLKLLTYRNGERADRTLAQHEPHGLWMDWQE